jgi:hypothetical protein
METAAARHANKIGVKRQSKRAAELRLHLIEFGATSVAPARHRQIPMVPKPPRRFVQSGFYEVALTTERTVRAYCATLQNPQD